MTATTTITRVTPGLSLIGEEWIMSGAWGPSPQRTLADMARDYRAGDTIVALVKKYHMSAPTIKKAMRNLGIMRHRGGQQASHRRLYAARKQGEQ